MRRNQGLAMLPGYWSFIHVEQYGFSIDQGKVKTAMDSITETAPNELEPSINGTNCSLNNEFP